MQQLRVARLVNPRNGTLAQENLLKVRNNVSGALDYLQDGLKRRQDVASVRSLLEIMQDTAHVMAKVRIS